MGYLQSWRSSQPITQTLLNCSLATSGISQQSAKWSREISYAFCRSDCLLQIIYYMSKNWEISDLFWQQLLTNVNNIYYVWQICTEFGDLCKLGEFVDFALLKILVIFNKFVVSSIQYFAAFFMLFIIFFVNFCLQKCFNAFGDFKCFCWQCFKI